MPRVRMFCDWDNTSAQLIDRLAAQTSGMHGNSLGGYEFVDDDTYDHAVLFNYPQVSLRSAPNMNIGLVLEPPEISSWMHPEHMRQNAMAQASRYFSFAKEKSIAWAPGLGFATVPHDYPYSAPSEKKNKACMIVSNKLMTDYHVKRHQIFQTLLESDLPIDFYGRGMEIGSDPRIMGEIAPMAKAYVLSSYSFCIDFENSPHGALTDKFFDPIICGTVPITNATMLRRHGIKGSYELVDFKLVNSTIKDKIATILDKDITQYDGPVAKARSELMLGSQCLARWITSRLDECVH